MSESPSDTTSDTQSLSSIRTIDNESLPLDQILKNLKSASKDAEDTKDFLSYSTLLDVYLSDPSKYSFNERELLLKELLAILTSNDTLVYEIGWDLPSLIIDYIDSDFEFKDLLRQAPCVYTILKIFEILALKGNPKELFLKSCELLNTLNIHDITTTDDYQLKERFLDLKLYCLLELVSANFRKIETLYPSKFLSMFVSSMVNFSYLNFKDFESENLEFLLKRVFTFAKNYNSLPLPKNADDAEVLKIQPDEEYLQRKLLVSLISNVFYQCGRNWAPNKSVLLLATISGKEIPYTQSLDVMDRFYELSLSFDIDFSLILKDFVDSTNKLFDIFLESESFNSSQEDEELSQIFEIILKDFQENLLTSISDTKEIQVNDLGLLIIYNWYIQSVYPKPINVTVKDSMFITIRIIVPMLIEPGYNNKALHDVVVSLTWNSLQSLLNKQTSTGARLELSAIPKAIFKIYLNCLIFIMSENCNDYYKSFRFTVMTLLTKILTLTPEQISYDFLRDLITNSPFHHLKPGLVGIFKELLTKDKVDINSKQEDPEANLVQTNQISELSKDLESIRISKPPLPSRNTEKSVKYMTLTKDRLMGILEMVTVNYTSCFKETKNGNDKEEKPTYILNPHYIAPLSTLLNLLVVLKNNKVFHECHESVDKLTKHLREVLINFKGQFNDSENELNMAELLLLTLDRI